MSDYLKRVWLCVVALFQTSPSLVAEKKERRRVAVAPARDIEKYGRWYFKRDILDRLEDYFETIRAMRRWDRSSYKLYSRIGAIITNGKSDLKVLPRCDSRVGFGAVFAPIRSRDEFGPWFCYFKKYETPPSNVQPGTGTVYSYIGIYLDRDERLPDGVEDWSKKDIERVRKVLRRGYPSEIWLDVWPDGSVHLLRCLHIERQRIRATTKIGKRRGGCSITHARWHFPEWLEYIGKNNPKYTLEQIAVSHFCLAYERYRNASQDVRVSVSRGPIVAAFAVDLLRMPYFFADRDATILARDGKKKRIFHIVRTHERNLKNGASTFVKSHFRGLRKFIWNNYRVVVSMPGKHHPDLLEWTAGAHDFDAMDSPLDKKMIGMKKLGKTLADSLEA